MLQTLFILLISFMSFAQDEAITELIKEHEKFAGQLQDQKSRTEYKKAEVEALRKKLESFRGDDEKKEELKSRLSVQESNLEFALKGERQIQSFLRMNEFEQKENLELPQYSQYLNCDENTPEINLEKNGPFKDVPRDNQDGLGTCFANTAKNLLVGLSHGEDIASFTDLALQYKSTTSNMLNDGLDGGLSCETLDAVSQKGFCPQSFSPMETGQRNYYSEGLFKQRSLFDLSRNIDLFKNFLSGLEDFSKYDPEVLSKAKLIVNAIQENPNVKIPLPVAGHNVLLNSYLKEIEGKYKIDPKNFDNEYYQTYEKFYPEMIKGLLAGKNLSGVFQIYQDRFTPLFQKFGIEREFRKIKKDFIKRAHSEFDSKTFDTDFRSSLKLLKLMTGKTTLSDEDFADYCVQGGLDTLGFLNVLNPIIAKIQDGELKTDGLFDTHGKFKNINELMQLLVAPACINPQNRKPLDFQFVCRDGYDTIAKIRALKDKNKEIRSFRSRVVLGLVQGMPLGNTFDMIGAAHINTIVGLRFNPRSKSCEYLIRESQDGTSGWIPEKTIYSKIKALTEVRRD